MVFSKIVSLLLWTWVSVFVESLPEQASVFYIVNGNNQCHECPNDIGSFLNKLKIEPVMLFRCSESSVVNAHRKDEIRSSYSGKFKFGISCDSLIFKQFDEVENFPFLLIVSDQDTVRIRYEEIFSGKKQSMNESRLKKIIDARKN